jgi:hypothetical protein
LVPDRHISPPLAIRENLKSCPMPCIELHPFSVVWRKPERILVPCAKQLPIHIWPRRVQKKLV